MLRRARLLLWVLVAVAAVLAALLFLRAERQAPHPAAAAQPVDFGGPFTLTASDGTRFSSERLAGKPYAIFFGFTHCPDVCPTTLARMARLRGQLGEGDDTFRIVFVSVDPERDSPAEMARYAALFDTPMVALTGTPAEIEAVKKLYGIFSEKVPQPGGGYSVDHSAAVLLIDRDRKFLGTIAPDEGDPAALAKLGRLTA